MKPRIKLSAYSKAPTITGREFRWQCISPGIYGFGTTPHSAYRNWKLKLIGVIE